VGPIRVISKVAAWLVFVFSLVSKLKDVAEVLATRARPLFTTTPLSQFFTAVVMSTETKVFAVATGMAETTELPNFGALALVMVSSFQAPFTIWTLNEPAVPTLLTYSLKAALAMLLPAVPVGRVEKSNFTNPRRLLLPWINIALAFPKLVEGFAGDTYESPVSIASWARALPGIQIKIMKRTATERIFFRAGIYLTNPPW
jgi:hypothetical protein